jgi:Tol biopolymer transport system component
MRRLRESRAGAPIALAFSSLIVLALLAVTACGGSGTSASSSPSSVPSQAAASAETTSSATPLPAASVAGTFVFAKVNGQQLGEIYVINGDGTGLKRLASKANFSLDGPVWSPDGTRIAYCHSGLRSPDAKNYKVWVMNADGSGQRKLTTGSVGGYDPAWSSDGTRVAFHGGPPQGGSGISVVSSSGGGLGRVTDVESDAGTNWTPSAKILFIRSGTDVYAVRPDGTGLKRVTKDGDVSHFAISPDGKTLAVYEELADRIVLLPADGGDPVTLVDKVTAKGYVGRDTYGLTYGVALTWSPDGKAIAFASTYGGFCPGSALYVVNADGSGLSVVPNTGMVWEPSWGAE